MSGDVTKERQMQAIADALAVGRAWHSSGGWFCDRCDSECGSIPDYLCHCCAVELNARVDFRAGVVRGTGGSGE